MFQIASFAYVILDLNQLKHVRFVLFESANPVPREQEDTGGGPGLP